LIAEVFNRSMGITWFNNIRGAKLTMGIVTESIFERWGRFV
jgi:hypothetical protein